MGDEDDSRRKYLMAFAAVAVLAVAIGLGVHFGSKSSSTKGSASAATGTTTGTAGSTAGSTGSTAAASTAFVPYDPANQNSYMTLGAVGTKLNTEYYNRQYLDPKFEQLEAGYASANTKLANVYTKPEADSAIGARLGNYYTKAEINSFPTGGTRQIQSQLGSSRANTLFSSTAFNVGDMMLVSGYIPLGSDSSTPGTFRGNYNNEELVIIPDVSISGPSITLVSAQLNWGFYDGTTVGSMTVLRSGFWAQNPSITFNKSPADLHWLSFSALFTVNTKH